MYKDYLHDVIAMRGLIVASANAENHGFLVESFFIKELPKQNRFNDQLDGRKEDWMRKMLRNAEYADEKFQTLAGSFLQRKLIFVPVFEQDGHANGLIEKGSQFIQEGEPFYMLYFDQTRFDCGGHFQSLRIKPNNNNENVAGPTPPKTRKLE